MPKAVIIHEIHFNTVKLLHTYVHLCLYVFVHIYMSVLVSNSF